MLLHHYKSLILRFTLLVLFSIGVNCHAVPEHDAVTLIDNFHSKLLHNMQNSESLGFRGRYDSISQVIDDSFDFPLIAKVILSRHWKQLSAEEKSSFIKQLTELTKTTYAARFSEYSDEQFFTIGTDHLRKGRLLIKTEIQSANEETVSLNYLLNPVEDEWKIISVIANGVNDLSLKRAEYSAIIKEKGFSGLMEDINSKIQEYKNL